MFFKGAPAAGDEVNPMADATAPMPAPDPPVAPIIPTLPDLTGKLPFVDSKAQDQDEPEETDSDESS